MPDQKAERIVRILIDIFSRYGIPEILHYFIPIKAETLKAQFCTEFVQHLVSLSRIPQHTIHKEMGWLSV